MKTISLLICSLLALAGCETVPRNIIASDKNFIVVEAGAEDSYASLATEFLGHANQASIIQRYNPGLEITRGSQVAIPKRNFNATSVFVDGYQRIPILCYHQFTDKAKTNSRMVVPQLEFEAQMAYLKNNGYQVIALKKCARFFRR